MKMTVHSLMPGNSTASQRRAFTLFELLVVIVVLGLLAVLVVPALAGGAKEKSTRAICQDNLRQIWLAVRLYADENGDKVPQTTVNSTNAPGSALWDVPRNTADMITRFGARREVLYCPSGSNRNIDGLWNLNSGLSDYRVTGYLWLSERNTPFNPGAPARRSDGLPYVSKLSVPFVSSNSLSQCELVADVVISEGVGNLSDKFEAVNTSNPALFPNGYATSHIRERLPDGSNILFQDGNIAWRQFRDMKRRVTWTSSRHWWW